MGTKSVITDITWIILFSLFIFTFITYFVSEKNNPQSDFDSSKYILINNSQTGFSSWIDEISKQANQSQEDLSKATPNANPLYSLFIISVPLFNIPLSFIKNMASGVVLIGQTLLSFAGANGGILQIIASITVALILIILVLSIIETLRTGTPGR